MQLNEMDNDLKVVPKSILFAINLLGLVIN